MEVTSPIAIKVVGQEVVPKSIEEQNDMLKENNALKQRELVYQMELAELRDIISNSNKLTQLENTL